MPIELSARKEVIFMEWITPDFEEYELECEVTAYAAHW
jgi:coenzyme PQQ precursor peptide PqqA